LSEYVECTGAKLEDGMLKVDLNYNPKISLEEGLKRTYDYLCMNK